MKFSIYASLLVSIFQTGKGMLLYLYALCIYKDSFYFLTPEVKELFYTYIASPYITTAFTIPYVVGLETDPLSQNC